jgi:hypothetical protein
MDLGINRNYASQLLLIIRTIVNDDDLEVFKGLRENGIEGTAEERRRIEYGNDDGYLGHTARVRRFSGA